MPSITSANVAQAIVKVVAAQAMAPLMGNLVMANIVNRDYEPALASQGDTVNVPIPANLVANVISESGTVTTQAKSLGNAAIILNQHAEVSFVIPDVSRALASPNLIDLYMQPALIALAEQMETDLLNLYAQFTANTATGAGTTIDEARIDTAESRLFAAKVPKNKPWALVLHGTTYGDARQIARFSELQTAGFALNGQGSPILTGSFGPSAQLKGFNVYRSQFVAKPSSTAYNLAFHPDAIGLAMRRLPLPIPGTGAVAVYTELGGYTFRIIMSYAPNSLAQQFTVDCLYGCGVLRNTHGVQVQST